MRKFIDRANHLPSLSRVSLFLILAGLLFLSLALFRSALAIQEYNSPFDEVDTSASYEVGFLPIISPEEEGGGPAGSAPDLPVVDRGAATDTRDSSAPDQPPAQLESTPNSNSQESSTVDGQDPAFGAGPDQLSGTASAPYSGPPEWISIPSIGVDGPVVPVGLREIEYKRQTFEQWVAPDWYAAGWHNTSALLGQVGNTVLNGHHNAFGEIFRYLVDLKVGDLIYLYSGDWKFTYKVGLNTRFNERFQPIEERLYNARWILPSQDERLTIITCWPYESNTHRVVIVAIPVGATLVRNSPTP